MSIFGMFGGGGSLAFKNQVKAINDNEALTDTEKMAAIDLLLNPPIVEENGTVLTFQGVALSFKGTAIKYNLGV